MLQEFKLELEKRKDLGKKAIKRLRREGKIPGVFYSSGGNSIPFEIDKKHLYLAFHSESHVYSVNVGGKKLHAIFKDVQYHPVTDEVLHVDLFGIRLKDKITLTVPVFIEGESVGVKAGGIMAQNVMELEILCLATQVPDAIHVNVEQLDVGDAIHVGDLDLEGIEIVSNPDITIVSVQMPKAEEIEVPVAEEEFEEVEEEGEEETAPDESEKESE